MNLVRAELERLARERAAILGQIADAVLIADPTGRITFVNEAGLEPFQNNPIWRLASFSGMATACSTCTSYIDTSEPENVAALGPAYRVMYFAGECCDNAVRQTIYPFGPGGPYVFNSDDVGTDFFDHSRQIPSRNPWERDRENLLHEASANCAVDRIDAGGMNSNQHFGRGGDLRPGRIFVLQNFRPTIFVDPNCFHDLKIV